MGAGLFFIFIVNAHRCSTEGAEKEDICIKPHMIKIGAVYDDLSSSLTIKQLYSDGFYYGYFAHVPPGIPEAHTSRYGWRH